MSATAWPQQGWSAPPAQSQPPVWSAPTHPGPKTDLLALLAIGAAALGTTVFLGLGSIAAIVLGFIALHRIKRTGEDGRLLAVWAIVLGIVTIIALAASTIISIGAIVAFAEQFGSLNV